MILQNKVNIANIPSISFNNGYSSVIDKVNNISNDDYSKLKKEMLEFCDITIKENKVKLNNYINKLIVKKDK